jgi:anti-sigma regulatory factor (Ser/Thr protein kinase)
LSHGSRYPTSASLTVADDRAGPPLAGAYEVTIRRGFPGTADQIARVREFVRIVLGPLPVVDEAVLLASELATNAVVHTASGQGGAFDVAVRRYPSAVRIEVHDAGSHRVPMPRPQDTLADEGRGLDLVNLVADRWGHSGDQSGRSVFFELCW